MKTGSIRKLPQGSDFEIVRIVTNPFEEPLDKGWFAIKKDIMDSDDLAVINVEITDEETDNGYIVQLEDGRFLFHFNLSHDATRKLYSKFYVYGIIVGTETKKFMVEKGNVVVKNTILAFSETETPPPGEGEGS